ncbi:MAG: hypothetical protein A2498_01430 [Lentisphaerae bacterium RIFOXYC12_FULL_60_16]|nr:MAG: hypothetical protein A2498_01430 [Lentisphaerae bacterium RIFOXYC12_FULL_60_16]
MPFVKVKGMPGKLFVPADQPNREKKHPCRDCNSCQWCSDERCSLCMKRCTKRRHAIRSKNEI